LAEDYKGQVRLIGKQYETIIEKLDGHELRLARIEKDIQIIKLDIEFIKHELKQKIDRDEFATLEKRVSLLEVK